MSDANTAPIITVAIPTVNRLHYLKEAVAAALRQTLTQLEVLIGDDGADASLRDWCQAACAQDPRVRYQKNPRRLGLASNWNALADAARGEFITIIGDDDRLLPEFAEDLHGLIAPDADVAFANHHLIDASGTQLPEATTAHTASFHRAALVGGELPNPAITVWQNAVPLSAALLRTSMVRRLRFKEDLNNPEIELFARLAAQGGRFRFTPRFLAEYRVHLHSATAAGLTSDKLAMYLVPLAVPADVEPYKRAFLADLLVGAAGCALRRGDTELARSFLKCGYYPGDQAGRSRRQAFHCLLQRCCASLPRPLAATSYKLLMRARSAALSGRSALVGATR